MNVFNGPESHRAKAGYQVRFWEKVLLREEDQGYGIVLDKKPLKLPSGEPLVIHNLALAKTIQKEWAGLGGGQKGQAFCFSDIPLTRIVGTMEGLIRHDIKSVIAKLIEYAQSDLLCFHSEKPKQIAKRQQEEWLPIVTWFSKKYQLSIKVTTTLHVPDFSQETIDRLTVLLDSLTLIEVTVLSLLVPLAGSLILGMAYLDETVTIDEVFSLSTLPERVQMEIWGTDAEQLERFDRIYEEMKEIEQFWLISTQKNG
ncbi:ATP12 chaperone protein [Entomobacter blattae]|uniref:ATP12 chaperone protein n=2 Tax=Entomobacter blattae TaxID=2762277 RepID=A0A7H1NT63_9PROT|nr:ATP12 chaperone protein [Entomobacter blattae]